MTDILTTIHRTFDDYEHITSTRWRDIRQDEVIITFDNGVIIACGIQYDEPTTLLYSIYANEEALEYREADEGYWFEFFSEDPEDEEYAECARQMTKDAGIAE